MSGSGARETAVRTLDIGSMDIRKMRRNSGKAASLLKRLANENRLLILCNLAEGEASVGELNRKLALSQSALSQHLAVLREEKLVHTRREAQTIYYSLADSDALPIIEALHRIYCE